VQTIPVRDLHGEQSADRSEIIGPHVRKLLTRIERQLPEIGHLSSDKEDRSCRLNQKKKQVHGSWSQFRYPLQADIQLATPTICSDYILQR
jgi:hypothetical protein